MIVDAVTARGAAALTSDHWHVVHARFARAGRKRPFERTIASEHDDRRACVVAAKLLREKVAAAAVAADVPDAERDQVFVRQPNFRSLKHSKSRPAGGRRAAD